MWRYIEQLQAKPESVRRRIVFIVSLSITILVMIVWLTTSLALQRGKGGNESAKNQSPFATIREKLDGGMDKVRGLISDVKTSFGSVLESGPSD